MASADWSRCWIWGSSKSGSLSSTTSFKSSQHSQMLISTRFNNLYFSLISFTCKHKHMCSGYLNYYTKICFSLQSHMFGWCGWGDTAPRLSLFFRYQQHNPFKSHIKDHTHSVSHWIIKMMINRLKKTWKNGHMNCCQALQILLRKSIH